MYDQHQQFHYYIYVEVIMNNQLDEEQILHSKDLVYNSSKITSLSGKNRERQYCASNSLAELVKNAGQFIIPKIIPILKKSLHKEIDLTSDDDGIAYKEGIAAGLVQMLENTHFKLIGR
eukprot:546768_1